MHAVRAWLVAALAGAAVACASATGPVTPSSAMPSPVATPSVSRSIVLHWMSMSLHNEPRYRLIYEGGDTTQFSELRLRAADGSIVATGRATLTSNEVFRLCGGGRSGTDVYGPLRVTLVLPTQAALGDVIQRTETYHVDVLVNGTWLEARTINECHGQD